MNYTDEQKDILREAGNCVIVATPGSGKTATITAMVQSKLELLRSHKGVIAISFTNKASAELQQRIRHGGTDTKSSFFGTIDKFFISEVIIPFGRHLWGVPGRELKVLRFAQLDAFFAGAGESVHYQLDFLRRDAEELGRLYQYGVVVLESVGFVACHIFNQSNACRRYLNARYTDVVIDEYQDCGEWQHQFFLSLVDSGVRGIAVGDLDQAIFGWTEKYPRFLRELTEDGRFNSYRLTKNHRCHPAIAHYATKFLSSEHEVPPDLDVRVFHAHVNGSEFDIGVWLNTTVPEIQARFGVNAPNKIAVLVRSNRTADLLKETLAIPYRHALSTDLDSDSTPACVAFKNIFYWLFNAKETRRAFLEEFVDPYTPKTTQRRVVHLLSELQLAVPFEAEETARIVETMVRIAEIMTAKPVTRRAARLLSRVLESGHWVNFQPPYSEEVQLMTIHKSKGLEFDVVVHLDLYEHVLPRITKEAEPEEANLHYVALTRAKGACILCTSSSRHNDYKELQAAPSPFLSREGLAALREPW
jgi:DNA helicase-2/ATP-dependent DNA helicase PcrA